MSRLKWPIAFLLICSMLLAAAESSLQDLKKMASQDESELLVNADSFESLAENPDVLVLKDNVRLEYGPIALTAAKVVLNRETLEFSALGNVKVTWGKDEGSWSAPSMRGNLHTRTLNFGPYRVDSPIWHGAGLGGEAKDSGEAHIQNSWLSTCDKEKPHYRFQARKMVVHTDRSFSARHVTLRFGDIPVFYFPWMWGDFEGMSRYIFKPGYSGKRGAYLRLGRRWKQKDMEDSLYVDLMSKRGTGVGAEHNYQSESSEYRALLYGLHDTDSPTTSSGWNRRFKSQDDRFRINLYSFQQSDWDSRFSQRMKLDYLSDIDMLQDWFKHDYRDNPQPRSFWDISYDGALVSGGLTLRPRVNTFYTVSETLPELRLDISRTEVPFLPLQYQSGTRIGYYSMKWRKFERKRRDLIPPDEFDPELHQDASDYQSFRAHTQHFLYAPLPLGSWSVLTPRAGTAVTYYSRSSKTKISQQDLANMIEVDNPDRSRSKIPVRNYDNDGGEVARLVYEVGAEWRADFYSDWLDWKSSTLEINGLAHVIEPYINYTFSPDPSHDRDHLYFFDEIDRLERQHFIRLGLDQRLLTRRDLNRQTVLRLQSYIDFHFDRDEEYGEHPGDLGNRVDFMPRDDVHFWAALLYDVGDGAVHRGETGVRFGKEDEPNFRFRYIYRGKHLSRSVWSLGSTLVDLTGESGYLKKYFEAANLVKCEFLVPINELTSLNISTEYDFERGRLSEHMYELRRQLHCWRMAFGVGWDNESFQVTMMFQLTAFPNVKIDMNL